MSDYDDVTNDYNTLSPSAYTAWKYGHGKNLDIINSISAIISTISSTLLIYIILQSKDQLSTTYHRLMLGISISDILLSLAFCFFNVMAPRDTDYMVWNAKGNVRTCDAQGFLFWSGAVSSLLYICSLNVYYLAKIRYNKSDVDIRSRLEPFLHGVPIGMALVYAITLLITQNYNDDMGGACIAATYDPPHCEGYPDGTIREGFTIPCGRGRNGNGATFAFVGRLIFLFVTPIIVGTCLWMIYRAVKKQEARIRRYGAGSIVTRINTKDHDPVITTRMNIAQEDNKRNSHMSSVSTILSSFRSSLSTRFQRKSSSLSNHSQQHPECSYSHVVAQRALAYSAAYVITWMWMVGYTILMLAGVCFNTGLWAVKGEELQAWRLAIVYLWNIFAPLNGFWNFGIFMHPKAMKVRQQQRQGQGGGVRHRVSWCRAFAVAIWSSLSIGKKMSIDHNIMGVDTTSGTNER